MKGAVTQQASEQLSVGFKWSTDKITQRAKFKA